MNIRLVLVIVITLTSGCATNVLKAWHSSNFEKTLGTSNPEFILEFDEFQLKTGRHRPERLGEKYSNNICNWYNEDKQLSALKEKGVISGSPTCFKSSSKKGSLIVEVGSLREKCIYFVNCLDRYIKYSDEKGNLLAYSEMEDLPYLDAIYYSIGHIKNMVIAANVNANRGNDAWKENLIRICKQDKSLRSVCG